MTPVCDRKRHLICVPYSIENLHKMAEQLGIKRCWFHAGKLPHYDIPAHRKRDIMDQCDVIGSKKLVKIIQEALGVQCELKL